MRKFLAIVVMIISGIYLLNFQMGIWELPDNVPIVGHIDEALAAALFYGSLRYFGIDLTDIFGTRKKKGKNLEG